MSERNHEYWMTKALALANKAGQRGEVPIAALIVDSKNQLISFAINSRQRHQTPLGHAELLALHKASQKMQSWRLDDCTMYVTLEPCVMCAGAVQQARLKLVVFGAADPKAGGVESLYKILQDSRLNHQTAAVGGVLANESVELLQKFFQEKRDEVRQKKAKKVYRQRSSVVVLQDQKVLGFHTADPISQKEYFFIPGGGIEPSETASEAAVRECFEETGYRIKVLEETAFEKKYDFFWNGQWNHSHTTFFVAELIEPWSAPKQSEVFWLPKKQIPQVFSYSPEILWAVQKLLKTAEKKSALRSP